MDEGRQWALEIFGKYGPRIRDDVAAMVKAEHDASADAQDASGHRSTAVYGQFYMGIAERFERFDQLPGVALVRPGGAPYKIPVINGVALFPWRFAKKPDDQVQTTVFGTSDARIALTKFGPTAVQEALDLGLPDSGLTDEEEQFFDQLHSVTDDPVVTTGRLVLVAISSSVHGLHALDWGEVALTDDGRLMWTGFHESLLASRHQGPVSASPTSTFTTGPIPSKLPQQWGDAVNTQRDE